MFLSDYGVVKQGHTQSLVPMPLKWLGIYDRRATPSKSFVKRVLPGPYTIWKIDWTPSARSVGGQTVLARAINAFQLHDSHPQAPLIPPNSFFDVTKKTGRVGKKDHGEGLGLQARRDLFVNKFKTSGARYAHFRRYVGGSRHTKTSDSVGIVLDYKELGPFDIRIECQDVTQATTHVSFIRVRCADVDVENAIRDVGRVVARKPGNARAKSGDAGKMFATGSRFQLVRKGGVLDYKLTEKTETLLGKIQHLNMVALRYLRSEFNELISSFHRLEHVSKTNKAVGKSALTETRNRESFIVPSMNFTVDLWNASHFDVNDGSYGVGMWASEEGTDVEDWEFVLPNVVVSSGVDCAGSGADHGTSMKGTRIKLFHGCVLSWEGTEIRHATARLANKKAAAANHTYSSHWCSSVKQHSLALRLGSKNKK